MRAWLYHRTKEPVLVESDEVYAALLADGWAETPAVFYTPEPEREKPKKPLKERHG